jgi:hypothetical protein
MLESIVNHWWWFILGFTAVSTIPIYFLTKYQENRNVRKWEDRREHKRKKTLENTQYRFLNAMNKACKETSLPLFDCYKHRKDRFIIEVRMEATDIFLAQSVVTVVIRYTNLIKPIFARYSPDLEYDESGLSDAEVNVLLRKVVEHIKNFIPVLQAD